jgi:hypothetical protein
MRREEDLVCVGKLTTDALGLPEMKTYPGQTPLVGYAPRWIRDIICEYLGPPWEKLRVVTFIQPLPADDLEVMRQCVREGRRTPALEAMLCMRRLGR